MSIETLDDIATDICNKLGIYGEERSITESELMSRMRDAVHAEDALERKPVSHGNVVTLFKGDARDILDKGIAKNFVNVVVLGIDREGNPWSAHDGGMTIERIAYLRVIMEEHVRAVIHGD